MLFILFAFLVILIVVVNHRENISRLAHRTESTFSFVKIEKTKNHSEK